MTDAQIEINDENLLQAPAHVPGRSWVSPLNFDPEVSAEYDFPKPLTIFDSTIRKILYTAGIRPSVDDILRVAEALEEAGVRENHLMVDFWGGDEPDELELAVAKAVLKRNFDFHSTVCSDSVLGNAVWGRDFNFDTAARLIDQLQSIGMETFGIGLRDPKTAAARDSQIAQLERVLAYLNERGISAAVDASDVGRTNFAHLVRIGEVAIAQGAIRFGLADSANALAPEAMKVFIRRLRARLSEPILITMHVHDDFGLASAVAIAAASAGAHPDVSVNGISYRAGFAALEEVVMSLEVLYGISTGIRTESLQHLSDVVAEASGFPVPPLKALVGSHAFIREIPHMVAPYVRAGRDSDVFPPAGMTITAATVGSSVRLVWGTHHSRRVIEDKLRQLELPVSDSIVDEVLARVDAETDESNDYPNWVLESQLEQILQDVVAAAPVAETATARA
jgi:isopropylmalate/homocitrate/citramalate synthase